MPFNQRLKKLKEHQDLLMTLLLSLKRSYFLLEPLLYSKVLAARISSTAKGEGYFLISRALFWYHIQEIWKIACDRGKKTPSLPNQFKIIEDPNIKSELKKQYSVWTSTTDKSKPELFDEIEKKEEEDRRKKFENIYEETLSDWRKLKNSNDYKNIQILRDKNTAHNEVSLNEKTCEFVGISKANLKFGDEWKFLKRLQKIIVNLDLLIRQSSFMWEDFDHKIKKSSLSFWDLREKDYKHRLS